jgi:hypothetical protein
MGGERQGWNTWERYLEAGLVDKTIHFTQEAVIRDHALGKTKDTIKKCWPMDAAVAYTLASAGPEANLTSKGLVNIQTKMAYAMMSQMVGYGSVPDPRKDSCGHDMIEGIEVQLLAPKLNAQGHIEMASTTRLCKWLESLEHEGKGAENLVPLSKFRIPKGGQDILSSSEGLLSIMYSKKYTPLREFIEKQLGTTQWKMTTGNINFCNQQLTSGVCKWAETPEKYCAHHDKPMYKGWVMIKQVTKDGDIIPNRFVKIWSRDRHSAAVHSGWNHDQIASKFGGIEAKHIAPARVVLWDTVKRNLANSVDNDPKKMKECIKCINESLRRMSARNMNVVTKEGLRNTATYNWKEWAWLHNLENWIAQTSKKGRKENDMICPDHNPLKEVSSCDKVGCNEGWVFTKYASKMTYGHEIASFKWVPTEAPKLYYVQLTSTTKNPFGSTSSWSHTNQAHFELCFHSLAEAEAFRTFAPMMGEKTGGVGMWERMWDPIQGKEVSQLGGSMKVKSSEVAMEMKPEKDPEETPTPKELLKKLKFGTPQEFDAAIVHLHAPDTELSVFNKPKILKEKKAVKNV